MLQSKLTYFRRAGVLLELFLGLVAATSCGTEIVTENSKVDGYRGIWYANQPSGDEFAYKYSGGLGTYCAKHAPFAVYSAATHKTFFCYGGATPSNPRQLVHMVSYFDHETGLVPRPTLLLDKQTDDAHDNPVISIDREGHIWIFSTSHGRGRPSFIHRSVKPYSVDQFERVEATYVQDTEPAPLDIFSYLQVWPQPTGGFTAFFTRYNDPAARTSMFITSLDGRSWSSWQRLAAIEEGHYQISASEGLHSATAFNFHPQGKGLNYRTNLYYLETINGGKSWQTAEGERVNLPLAEIDNPALVHDFASEQKNVYIKDMLFDDKGLPIILVITSNGFQSGPANGPRHWRVFHWDGQRWHDNFVTGADSNYDMGSLYLEGVEWRLLAPTASGPQPYNPGGEVCLWVSRDQGVHWKLAKQLTFDSEYNHTYVRRPLDAHPEFYGLWADGDTRRPSVSRLYFCNREGIVFQLPLEMKSDYAKPLRIE